MTRYVDDGAKGIDLPPNRQRWTGTHLEAPRISLPGYTAAAVAICPDCGSDLDNEGIAGYWCPACRYMWMFSQVITAGDIDE